MSKTGRFQLTPLVHMYLCMKIIKIIQLNMNNIHQLHVLKKYINIMMQIISADFIPNFLVCVVFFSKTIRKLSNFLGLKCLSGTWSDSRPRILFYSLPHLTQKLIWIRMYYMCMQLRQNSTILGFLKVQKILQIFRPHFSMCKNW